MASAQLTDQEIFSALKRLGFTPGPVTESTRPVYLKKLKKLREEQRRGSRRGGGGSSGNAAARAPNARPPTSDVTRRSDKRSSGRTGRFVLGFSSDESDVEAPQKKADPGYGDASRGDRGSASQTPVRPAGSPAARSSDHRVSLGLPVDRKDASRSPWWADRTKSSTGVEDLEETETDSRSFHLSGSRSSSRLVKEFSDTEEEEEEEGGRDRPHHRRFISRHSPPRSVLSSPYLSTWRSEPGVRAHDTPDFTRLAMAGELRKNDGKESGFLSLNYPKRSSFLSGYYDNNGSSPSGFTKNHLDNGDDESTSSSRFSVGLRPRLSYTGLSATYRPNHSSSNHSYSRVSSLKHKHPEDDLLQQFKREEVSMTGGFSAHYLSMILLTTACLFFLLLGLMYVRMRGSSGPETAAVMNSHPFGDEFEQQYEVKVRDNILKLLLSLHEYLANLAGEHDCGDQSNPSNRSVSLSEASEHLKLQNEAFEDLMETSLEWIIKTRDAVGIKLIGSDPDRPVEKPSDVSRLESVHPRMSFFCRFRRAFFTVILRLLLILTGVGVVWGLVWYVKNRWHREEEEKRQMYEMVERIIDVMRSHSEACQENKELQPYLPVPHIRDSLIPPHHRKKMKRVWDRAVSFLSANESRIRTETQRIGGADCTVWRWLQTSASPDRKFSMTSKVWQGKAFPPDRRNSPPNSLTPCLKIRNMFDPIMEDGQNWHLAIQEAILEKCSDNDGIVHIAVDRNSREGCVYVKCLSAEHSGKAFKALHGSWFDGKLVTVKYLRLDRYHQRFPQALGCNTPLKPSSSSMESLSPLSPLGFS